MRTTLIAILLFAIVGCSNSQSKNKDFTDFYNRYQDDSGIVTINIPVFLAKILVDDNDRDAHEALSKLRNLRLFICENDDGFYKNKVQEYMPEGVYHDLMIIKDGKETVAFKMKEPVNGRIKEIVMTVSEPNSFVAICFKGNFTMEDAKQMTSSIRTGNIGSIQM